MAYATKYLFKWESSNGTTREIRVQKDGYSGSVIQRRLGRAPVLKKQRNGTVFGTSLEFYAECAVDGEFAEFYTSDPKAYKVLLYTGSTLLWQGYVTPELYSEPDIAPPYDVQVIATDGIGELKLYDFAAQGVKTLRQMFTYLLGYTGLGTDVYLISSMKAGSSGAGALLDKTINLDYKVGDTCYEVLTYLLDTLHATITWWRGAWIVARETNVTFSSSKVRYYNTSGNSALLTGSVVTLGKMYTNDAWPVGQLTQKIDPAKKSVTIQAPWHVNDAFVNGPMDTDTGWTKTNNASWNSTKKGYNLPDNGQTTDLATVSQSISMLGMRVPMDFVGKFCASLISGQMYNGVAGVAVDYVTSGNVTYHLGKDSEGNPTWVSGSSGNTDYDFQIRLTAVDTDDANAEALSFTIPALAVGTSYPAGTLTVRIVGRSAIVFSASLDVVIAKGYQDRLHIDNGARGEEGTVEIAIGRETSDIDYYKAFMQGLLLDSGSLITSFKDDNLTTATDFLSYISRDYARSFALPRIVQTGKVYLEDGVFYPPLVLSKGAVDYWLETFSWDMYEDELDISARSLPTATITVESEVIAEYGTGTASSSSSSGGGATPITPIPSVLPNPYALTFGNKSYDGSEPVTLTASDIGALTGITAAMVNAAYGFTISGTAGSTYNLGNLHTHSNKSVLDDITANNVNDWNAAALVAHSHSNKSVLDGITSSLVTNWNTAYTNNHTHSNKSLLDSMTINWDNYFGIDSDGNVYVKKDGDNPRHFYSYGAVSAGGLSPGGGTGGIDLAAMWASLQNNDIVDTYDSYKFAAAHLPACGTGLSYTTDSDGLATGINVSFPVTSVAGYTGAVTTANIATALTSAGYKLTDTTYSAGTGLSLSGATFNHSNSVTAQTTQGLYPIKIDAQGHISAYGSAVTSLPASDVYSWAKQASKPSYSFSEITGTASTAQIPDLSGTYLPKTGGVMSGVIRMPANNQVEWASGATMIYGTASEVRVVGTLLVNGNTAYHSGNFNPNDYLPLTGGTLTGALKVDTIQNQAGTKYLVRSNSGNPIIGNGDGTLYLATSGDIYNYVNNANNYKVFHEGNANKSDVPWNCSIMTINASPQSSYSLYVGGTQYINGQIVSGYSSGAPFSVLSTTRVDNLNADLLDGKHDGELSAIYLSSRTNGSELSAKASCYEVINGTSDSVLLACDTYGQVLVTSHSWASTSYGYRFIYGVNTGKIGYQTKGGGTWATAFREIWHTGNAGSTSHPWACSNLEASGVIHASTGIYSDGYVTAGSASSREFKDNVQNMSLEYARNIIMSSRPITFQWNALAHSLCDKYEGDGIGFIAQEAEQLMPFAVSPIFEKYKRLDYTAYVSPLVRMSQYLLTTTDNHETRIKQLERESREKDAKIVELENTIARLTN